MSPMEQQRTALAAVQDALERDYVAIGHRDLGEEALYEDAYAHGARIAVEEAVAWIGKIRVARSKTNLGNF